MVITGCIADFIREPGKTEQIQEAISEGEYYRMQTPTGRS
jgi:Tfp pilus assembly pilus retraction ATPase PilT